MRGWLTRGNLALKTECRFLAVAEHKLIRAMSKMLLKPLCVQVLSVNQELPLVRTTFLLVMPVLVLCVCTCPLTSFPSFATEYYRSRFESGWVVRCASGRHGTLGTMSPSPSSASSRIGSSCAHPAPPGSAPVAPPVFSGFSRFSELSSPTGSDPAGSPSRTGTVASNQSPFLSASCGCCTRGFLCAHPCNRVL